MSESKSDINTTSDSSASNDENIHSPIPKKSKTKYYAYDRLQLATAIHFKHNNSNVSFKEVSRISQIPFSTLLDQYKNYENNINNVENIHPINNRDLNKGKTRKQKEIDQIALLLNNSRYQSHRNLNSFLPNSTVS